MPNILSVVGDSTAPEAVAAAKVTPAELGIHHLETAMSKNPAGDGIKGLRDLDLRLTKASKDVANDVPISVVPDNAGDLPPIPESADFKQSFTKVLREDIPDLAPQLEEINKLSKLKIIKYLINIFNCP